MLAIHPIEEQGTFSVELLFDRVIMIIVLILAVLVILKYVGEQ